MVIDMDSLKSPKLMKAEIYKNIFLHKEFKNPMTNSIISLKHKLSLKFQQTHSEKMRESIKVLFELLDYFKTYTDDISGANMKSKKTIYEIYDTIEKHLKMCGNESENLYKMCLSSILDSDDLLDLFSKLEISISQGESDTQVMYDINCVIKHINGHIQADKLAYANLKQETLLYSINESLRNVVCKTKDNLEMYTN